MAHNPHPRQIDRRSLVKASLGPVTTTIFSAAFSSTPGAALSAGSERQPLPLVDTNVHLFEWPFRRLKYDRTATLVNKLRKHQIRQAWAGSFRAVLATQLDSVNQLLANECVARGQGILVPIGSVNPADPGWEEDLRRCHEQYRMPGVRLYPTYHGYDFVHAEFKRLLQATAARGVFVQIALRLEDERVHHPALQALPVNVDSLADVLQAVPAAKVQLINAAGPLLGNHLRALVQKTQVTFDIAAIEGNGGVERVIAGTNYSYRGAIPVERLLFGSHAPFFPVESALLKLFESPLSLEQLVPVMHGNAARIVPAAVTSTS